MSFPSQFSLSLELTQLLPISLAATKAAEVVMSLARDLQNSGSDIVIEEDLACIFGRSRISRQFESSFKTVVTKSRTTPLFGDIYLQSGPGPTVGRSLQHPAYFSTVVQLSLLSWFYSPDALAEVITEAMQKRMAGAPPDHQLRALPDLRGIAGVIKACEEQTSAFDWNGLLFAVASHIGLDEIDPKMMSLPPVVLQGAMDMFPAVQVWSEDRMILVESGRGHCPLIVWAHHVLGLTTLLKKQDGSEIRFGKGPEQLIIQDNKFEPYKCSMTLLDSKQGDVLLCIQAADDDLSIETTERVPAEGYGRERLSEFCLTPAIGEEMEHVIVAFAYHLSKHLFKSLDSTSEPLVVEEKRLIRASQFFFKNEQLTSHTMASYIETYAASRAWEDFEPPASIYAWCRQNDQDIQTIWISLRGDAGCLVVLLLSFTHVRQVESLASVPLRNHRILYEHPLVAALASWDGHKDLLVQDNYWFGAIALVITGQSVFMTPLLNNVCLLSARGWSVYLNTFGGNDDPGMVEAGSTSVAAGVPIRNGIRKRGVIDGPPTGLSDDENIWEFTEQAGEEAMLRSTSQIESLPVHCTQQMDHFMVSLRLLHTTNDGVRYLRRSGFREYHRSLWNAVISKPCGHPVDSAPAIKLSPGFVTVTGFPTAEQVLRHSENRIIILLTAHNYTARWRALVGLGWLTKLQVLLRAEGCCFTCVVDQVSLNEGRWCVIL